MTSDLYLHGVVVGPTSLTMNRIEFIERKSVSEVIFVAEVEHLCIENTLVDVAKRGTSYTCTYSFRLFQQARPFRFAHRVIVATWKRMLRIVLRVIIVEPANLRGDVIDYERDAHDRSVRS